MVEKTETFKILNHSNNVNENVAIRPLICDSWSISLTDLADEILQLSENKNHKQVKLRKKLHRMYVTLERSFGIIKGL